MMMQQEAKILVVCGYATDWAMSSYKPNPKSPFLIFDGIKHEPDVDPYADTLEGRKQADAIELYMIQKQWVLWAKAAEVCWVLIDPPTPRNFTLEKIKWCMKQLEDDV